MNVTHGSHLTKSLPFDRLHLFLEDCAFSGPARLRERESGIGAEGGGYRWVMIGPIGYGRPEEGYW